MMILSGIEPCRKPHRHSPQQGSEDFAIILFNCDVSDPRSLYDSHWAALSEDYAHRQPSLSEQHLQDLLVRKLDALLGIMHSRSVFEWIPSLRTLLVEEHGSAMDNNSVNHLLELQLSSSNTDIQQQLDRLPLLNLEQRAIFDAVLASVNNNAGTENQKNVYFVDGPAGSEKAEVMKVAKILIIDEITMLKGVGLDVLSQSLCDLLERNDAPFGGLVVVMGGDFRQVLPILRHAGRATTVHSTVLQSKVWQTSSVNVMQLSENMRLRMDLQNTNANPEFQEVLSHFASFLLRIGEDMEPSQ
ncbi:PIF1-like helicase [Fragilaria crotonensis]|nr:PIF1-like helicase [Fragilaria crotonensis]